MPAPESVPAGDAGSGSAAGRGLLAAASVATAVTGELESGRPGAPDLGDAAIALGVPQVLAGSPAQSILDSLRQRRFAIHLNIVDAWLAHPLVPAAVGLQLFLFILVLAVLVDRARQAQTIRADLAAALGVRLEDVPPMSLSTARAMLAAAEPLAYRNAELSLQAMFDDLTGLYRRGAGLAFLARELARCDRSLAGRLTVAFVDVDGLKRVNDSLGHAAGDKLLQTVAATITARLRANDLAFRYGGDEFVCVFADLDAALASRVMGEIALAAAAGIGREAISFGLAAYRRGEKPEQLITRADGALYAGRTARSR